MSSTASSCSTEPWFCEPCQGNVINPPCQMCPNLGKQIIVDLKNNVENTASKIFLNRWSTQRDRYWTLGPSSLCVVYTGNSFWRIRQANSGVTNCFVNIYTSLTIHCLISIVLNYCLGHLVWNALFSLGCQIVFALFWSLVKQNGGLYRLRRRNVPNVLSCHLVIPRFRFDGVYFNPDFI